MNVGIGFDFWAGFHAASHDDNCAGERHMTPLERVRRLPIWRGEIDAQPLGGGITNVNFVVQDADRRAVVRIGDDIPVHQIMRFNELSASRAAFAAGISPAVLHHEPGVLVIDFVEGRTLSAQDMQQDPMLDQALDLVMRAHRDMPRHLRGPALMFWVFHVLNDYAATLRDGNSRHLPFLADLLIEAERLERAVGAIDLVFGHNDLLPANFLHDGSRLWLIDWDYAGFNSPLFDLGGLAANNGLTPRQEEHCLEVYFDRVPTDELRRQYLAMKAASALRETMWSMVSELHSELDFDFAAYTAANLTTYRAALSAFEEA
jgi:thiamine kinase-like enzyme